jgi:hypothetical protein
MPILSLAVLGALGFVGFHLYHASFMRHTFLYAVGAIFIYWFSVSGGAGLACVCPIIYSI